LVTKLCFSRNLFLLLFISFLGLLNEFIFRVILLNLLVIGGGVVGVTTAYYLSQKGLNVTVLETQEKDADFGATAGNAGLLSPSDAFA
jgi:heterodisulfide reductase subunit A-like polyferredoxin